MSAPGPRPAPRDPDAILAELGRGLRGAWRRPPRRSRLAGWRRSMGIVAATLVVVPTSLATRDAVWAPAPAPLPDAARPPGGVQPSHAGEQVYVGSGELRGVGWRLSASACDYAALRAVGVFLSVPGGGGGARCDIASDGAGGVTPDALSRRLVQTYFDPVAGRTWAFGALPAAARSVDVVATGARATVAAAPADAVAVGRGDLPAGMRVFVAALDGARDVPLVTARNGSGRVLLVCRDGRCTAPTPKGSR
jgi:hypothetical protein